MVSTFTTNKNIEKPGHNDYPNTWDVPVNADWDDIDEAFGGTLLKNVTGLSGTIALTIDEARPPTIQISGTPTAAVTYTIPSGVGGSWIVRNNTTGGFNIGLASAAGGSTVTVPAGNAQQMWCDGSATGMLAVNPPSGSIVVRSYLAGLTLSNDVAQPNTVLDVAGGICADSTNTVNISLGAITKSTGGSWVAGTSQFGMGNGLVIAASTWYHVFAIINNGAADVYFDTSVNAANAPTGTTAVRRIGSFKTNTLAQIVAFTQFGDQFYWSATVQDVNGGFVGLTATTLTLASVPTGVKVTALMRILCSADTLNRTILFYSPQQGTQAANTPGGNISFVVYASTQVVAEFDILTDTAARIAAVASVNSVTVTVNTFGWIDRRGQDS